MKISTCRRCRHKLFSIAHTPRYCRNCGSESVETNSYLEWMLVVGILALIIYLIGF